MTPREFCRQSLEALRLPTAGRATAPPPALETLLGYFAGDDLPRETFEFQLRLLAGSDVCPHLAAAATRLLCLWARQRAWDSTLAGPSHRN